MSFREPESDEPEAMSHAEDINATSTASPPAQLTSISQSSLPTWSFNNSSAPDSTTTSTRHSPSPPVNPTDQAVAESIFSPRPSPSHGPHQQTTAPELDLASAQQNPSSTQPTQQTSLFNTPNRSIFSSGPPTASISANIAHASMSSPPPVRSSRPLSALNGPSASSSKRLIHYPAGGLQSPRKNRISRAEKDIDDPSASLDQTGMEERRSSSTPTALTSLFAAPEANPIVSRHSSYIRTASGTAYTRATATETAPLPHHLYSRGLMGGRHSDIMVHAFNTRYPLHRLLLDRSSFFSSALSEPWFESSSKEITLHPEDIDSNITIAAFELALKRLYGCHVPLEEEAEPIGLFATGCWLEMPDLIDASVASILRQMTLQKLGSLISLVTTNYYGKPGDRILASAKAMLCREGWEMPIRHWDGVSGEIAREIIGGDGFFVPGEWERWLTAKRVFDRRLKMRAVESGLIDPTNPTKRGPPDTMRFSAIRFDAVYRRNSTFRGGQLPESYDPWLNLYTSPDIAALLVLLDEGIHYVHLSFEQLQRIRDQRDVLGLPLVSEKVINDALWMQMELRQRVRNAPELDLELGLSQAAEDNPDGDADESHVPSAAALGKGKQADTQGYNDQEEVDESELESGSWDGNGKPRKFWIPNLDSTSIMGGNPDAGLCAAPSSHRPYISRLSASIDPVDVQWASDFTASANERPTTADRSDPVPPICYTHYPPFRFAAEFPNPRNLKEKKRVYSRTVWYAGSLWNVYIQKVETTKNTQLGVYLHRAKEKEGQDDHHLGGSVDERIGQVEQMMRRNYDRRHRQSRGDLLEEENSASGTDPDLNLIAPEASSSRTATITNLLRGGGSSSGASHTNNTSGSTHDGQSVTKSSQSPSISFPDHPQHFPTGNSDSDDNADDPMLVQNRECGKTHHSVPTLPTYVDGRPTIKTYFKIYSPSKGGRMLSVYESAPDLFNFSQSWGWKSSTMVLDDGLYGYDGGAGGAENGGTGAKSSTFREGRLRFMVVIGNV